MPSDVTSDTFERMKKSYIVEVQWDGEEGVWLATSKQVLGLCTEASTIKGLLKKLDSMIPELLSANGIGLDTPMPHP